MLYCTVCIVPRAHITVLYCTCCAHAVHTRSATLYCTVVLCCVLYCGTLRTALYCTALLYCNFLVLRAVRPILFCTADLCCKGRVQYTLYNATLSRALFLLGSRGLCKRHGCGRVGLGCKPPRAVSSWLNAAASAGAKAQAIRDRAPAKSPLPPPTCPREQCETTGARGEFRPLANGERLSTKCPSSSASLRVRGQGPGVGRAPKSNDPPTDAIQTRRFRWLEAVPL